MCFSCYSDGSEVYYYCLSSNRPQDCLDIMAGDSNYVIWAIWGHMLHDIMISWSAEQITPSIPGEKDDFISKYCIITL